MVNKLYKMGLVKQILKIKLNIGYITIKKIDDYENIYNANPLYLTITHANGNIECNSVEEKGVNKYLVFNSMELHSTDENKDYEQDYMKIKFNSDDDLPLNN